MRLVTLTGFRSELVKIAEAVVHKPPDPVGELTRPSVFLAGSIEMGKAVEWQRAVEDALRPYDVEILDPRRDNWDSTWTQRASNPQFKGQVEWELDNLDRADVVAIYFDENTASPISLLELGLHAKKDKIVVCCPPKYFRRGNVEIVCARYGIPLVDTFDEFVAAIKALLGIEKVGMELDVPLSSQGDSYSCGVASLRSVLDYYGIPNSDDLVNMLHPTRRGGTRVEKIVALAEAVGLSADPIEGMNLDQLYSYVDRGIPVIVAYQAWGKPGTDYSTDWADGHYSVVTGHENGSVILMDPSTRGTPAQLPEQEFVQRWHDEDVEGRRYVQLGIVIMPK